LTNSGRNYPNRGNVLDYGIHKVINSIWNKEELPKQRKKRNILPDNKKGDKPDCIYYKGILLVTPEYKILPNIFV
jgi:hypothetical protein